MSMSVGRLAAVLLIALPLFPATPKPKAVPLTPDQRAAQVLMKTMSLRDKAAQLVIVVANGEVYSAKSPD
jgi:hypothetical protein